MPNRFTGVLNLVKPVGITSHDVVSVVRRLSSQKAVGHAGTLDPLATGVLVVLLGRATALSAYAMHSRKQYAAEVVFGAATDTDDAEGRIVRTSDIPDVSSDDIIEKLEPLTGDVMQVPPRYSAIKVNGRTAYAEARKGRNIELEPRRVQIHSIRVLSWNPPRLRLLIETGPGAYIRSLARDAGEALNSTAYLHSLVRLSSGGYHYRDAVALEELSAENLAAHILPADSAVMRLRAAFLSPAETDRVTHGGSVRLSGTVAKDSSEVIRLYSAGRTLLALANPASSSNLIGNVWQPIRVLV